MPFTLSHPLAVLPLRRYCPGRLSFLGLLVGSAAPDFGYYVAWRELSYFSHTPLGMLLAALPLGLGVALAARRLQSLVAWQLPEPHAGRFDRLLREPTSTAGLLTSLAIGIALHVSWDQFTHQGTVVSEAIPWLREPAVTWRGHEIVGSKLAQHASTIIGGAGMLCWYWLTLPADSRRAAWDERLRALLLMALAASALGSLWGVLRASALDGFLAFRVLVIQTAVGSTTAFLGILLARGVVGSDRLAVTDSPADRRVDDAQEPQGS